MRSAFAGYWSQCNALLVAGSDASFAIDLQSGDVYGLAGNARWNWRHGISIETSENVSGRKAIVWRFIEL